MKIALDGPAGSGKSSIAKALAKRLGYQYLDTGALYRAATLLALEAKLDLEDASSIVELAKTSDIHFVNTESGQALFAGSRDISADIRTDIIDQNVSLVSSHKKLRAYVLELLQSFGASNNVIAEGRDIATVVFPDAELKIYLSATPEARAHRRALQKAKAQGLDSVDLAFEKAILDDLIARDNFDSNREVAPLKQAADAKLIDSSNMSFDEVLSTIEKMVQELQKPKEAPKPKKKDELEALKPFAGNDYADYWDRPFKLFPWPAKALKNFVFGVLYAATKIMWPWKIENFDAIIADDKAKVIIMNHTSAIDPIPVALAFWKKGLKLRAVYKSEYNKTALVRWFFSRVGAIPVERGEADIKAIRRSARALEAGEYLLIYPEGTRIKTDDQPVEIHGGFALIAQMAKAPVATIALVGAREIKPKGKKLFRFKPLYLKAGKIFHLEDMEAKARKAKALELEEKAMAEVYRLRDELRLEHPHNS